MSDRKEKKLAHAKQREEIRNAVHKALVDSGLDKQALLKGMDDLIQVKVKKQVEKVEPRVEGIVNNEIARQIKGIITKKAMQDAIAKQIEAKAKEFVERSVKITIVDEDTW